MSRDTAVVREENEMTGQAHIFFTCFWGRFTFPIPIALAFVLDMVCTFDINLL